jgi:hypothetical protein
MFLVRPTLIVALTWLAFAAAYDPSYAEELAAITHRTPDQPPRTWLDDSGYHCIEGRLFALGPEHVVLLKANERYSTVPLARLGRLEQQYVAAVRESLAASSSGAPVGSGSPTLNSVSGSALIYITATTEFLQRFTEPRAAESDVDLCILGFPVQGVARTNAGFGVGVLPTSDRATIEIQVRGTVTSRTVSDASAVQVHSRGFTSFTKRIWLLIDERGVEVESFPARSNNNIATTGITTSARRLSRLVLRIAGRRVAANKPLADQVAVQEERARLDASFEAAATDMATQINQSFRKLLADLAATQALSGMQVRLATNESSVNLYVMLPTSEQPTSPPAPADATSQLVIRMHSSVVNEKITGDTLAELQPILDNVSSRIPRLGTGISEQLDKGESESYWSPDKQWLTILWSPE